MSMPPSLTPVRPTKRESQFWNSLRNQLKKLKPKWIPTRLESIASLGLPDLLLSTDHGFHLIELKQCSGNTVRLSPHQVSFLTKHQHANVWVWIRLSKGEDTHIYSFSGDQAIEVAERGLRTKPVVLLKNPRGEDWNVLFESLT